jgi:hypothetical protein
VEERVQPHVRDPASEHGSQHMQMESVAAQHMGRGCTLQGHECGYQ